MKLATVLLIVTGVTAFGQIPVTNCTIVDWSAGTNGSSPTGGLTGNVGLSVFPPLVSANGASVSIANASNVLQFSNNSAATMVPWLITPTCAGSWTPTTTVGMEYIGGGTPTNNISLYVFNNGTTGINVGSMCGTMQTNVPQTYSTIWGDLDTFDLLAASGADGFTNPQVGNGSFPGTSINWDMECGGCVGGTTSAPSSVYPSNTPVVLCQQMNPAGSKDYIGFWNVSTGKITAGTLAQLLTNNTATPGGWELGSAVNAAPAGYAWYWGSIIMAGFLSNQTKQPFPLAPGLQIYPPEITLVNTQNASSGSCSSNAVIWQQGTTFPSNMTSMNIGGTLYGVSSVPSAILACLSSAPGTQTNTEMIGGIFSGPQIVSMDDLPSSGLIYYTLDGTTPSCTLGANDVVTGHKGTLYTGSITLYITTTINAIACLSYYQNSTVMTATYTIKAGAGILAPSRSIDWTQSGANPGYATSNPVPDAAWTQQGSTIAACGTSGTPVSPSSCGISSALSSCSGGKYVLLAAGNFYLNAGVSVPAQCELKGSGSNSTFLYFTAESNCNGTYSEICLAGSDNGDNAEQNYATWTAGFTQGATSITLSNSTNIVAGSTIIAIDQQDETSDTGNIWNCVSSACGGFGQGGAGRTDHTCTSSNPCIQLQYVLVTACSPSCNSGSSTTLTISPGLAAPNWASAKSTGAYWATTVGYQMGVRDLSIDDTNTTNGTTPIVISNCYECFAYNWRSIYGARNHVNIQFSKNITVANGYMFNDSVTGTSSYAVELYAVSDSIVENNICQQVVECVVNNGGGTGNVIAANFSASSISSGGAGNLTPMDLDHSAGDQFYLWEEEISSAVQIDNTHGTHHFFTNFRNLYPGWAAQFSCDGASCTQYTNSAYIYGGSRYGNLFANLWGQAGYHNALYAAATSSTCNGTATTEVIVGCSNPGGAATGFCNNAPCSAATSTQDILASSSLAFYDNYDIETGAICTGMNTPVSGCAGQTASSFQDTTGNPSSYVGLSSPGASPPSLMFASSPSFWQNNGTSIPFPAIGPDVSGGNLLRCTSGTYSGSYVIQGSQCSGGTSTTAYAGHANAIPAMACALSTMNMPPDGSGSVLPFNAGTCYASQLGPGSSSSVRVGPINITGPVFTQ